MIFYTFSFFWEKHAIQRIPNLDPPSQQSLPKLQFLQKLGCQKHFWDQASKRQT